MSYIFDDIHPWLVGKTIARVGVRDDDRYVEFTFSDGTFVRLVAHESHLVVEAIPERQISLEGGI